MIHLQWKTSYRTGNHEVDLQHEYFASLINRLAGEIALTDSKAHKARLLNELKLYAQFHFTSEENLIHRDHPEHLVRHREIHLDLLDRLANEILRVGEDDTNTEELLSFLCDWFVQHTVREDRRVFNPEA